MHHVKLVKNVRQLTKACKSSMQARLGMAIHEYLDRVSSARFSRQITLVIVSVSRSHGFF